MVYVHLLLLLPLLVHPPYIRGDDSNGQDIENEMTNTTEKANQELQSMVQSLTTLDIALKEVKVNLARQERRIEELKVVCRCSDKPRSCAEIDGGGASGIHQIYPNDASKPVKVMCDNSDGGGWTVIQKRYDGSVDFFRGWEKYAQGFGDPAGEYWLGLRYIHALTQAESMELYVGMTDSDRKSWYAKYSSFSVSSEEDKFRLHVGTYSGTAGDGLRFHNDQRFSTKDQDNDKWDERSCSVNAHGAWWYYACHKSHLNGVFLKVNHYRGHIYMSWSDHNLNKIHVKTSVMMIRPSYFRL